MDYSDRSRCRGRCHRHITAPTKEKIKHPCVFLKRAFKDLRSEGIEGVKKHLTANALQKLNDLQAWTEYPLFDIITKAVSGNSKEALIKQKIAECDWTIVDILKSKSQAKGVVRFKHADGFSGTVDVVLIKENYSWKIDSLNSPKID